MENTSQHPSKRQPWAPHQCEYTYTWIQKYKNQLRTRSAVLSVRLSSSLPIISRIMETTEEAEQEETAVSELRTELWLKERELTDIRLEALGSAHQLEQLRDAMNNMQVRFPLRFKLSRRSDSKVNVYLQIGQMLQELNIPFHLSP